MSKDSKLNTNISADVRINPKLSQIVLTVLTVIAGLCYATCFLFLWFKKEYWGIPLSVAIFLTIGVLLAWYISYRSIDMGNSTPTKIITKEGLTLITDPRTFDTAQALKNLASVLDIVAYRDHLPDADGLLDSKGEIIPDSKDKAVEITRIINEKLAAKIDNVQSEVFDAQKINPLRPINSNLIDDKISIHNGVITDKA